MCGIGGILRTYPAGVVVPSREESILEEWLDILDDSIKHRGPDGCGRFRDRVVRADGTTVDVALIHRRMAIIDLEGGHQPMLLRPEEPGGPRVDDQLAVVFNGCIYNHRELRKELEALGAEFRTDHSDTEVLLWGWRYWQTELFARLLGMGAIILWDAGAAKFITHVVLPYEKPLWETFWYENYISAYCSCASGLLRLSAVVDAQSPLVPKPADTSTSKSELNRWMKFGRQLISKDPSNAIFHIPVKRSKLSDSAAFALNWLRAGYSNSVKPGSYPCYAVRDGVQDSVAQHIEVHKKVHYWDATNGQLGEGWNLHGSSVLACPTPSELDHRIRGLVQARMEADVSVGALLSGGVDSSLIVAHARVFSENLKTFCLRMPNLEYDESARAAAVAKRFGTRHVEVLCGSDAATDVVRLIEQAGIPFGDSSLLPTYWIAKAASQYCKVLLTGDGGDELFYGYERYAAERWRSKIGTVAWLLPTSLLPRGPQKSLREKCARFFEAAKYGYESLLHVFPIPMMKKLQPDIEPLDFGLHFLSGADNVRKYDLEDVLPGDYLRKVDLATMAVPIESRAPFLDQQFMLEMLPLTAKQAMTGGRLKGLLKDTLKLHLPSELVDRPKMGFAIPLADWFRSDFGGLRSLLGDLVINAAEPFPAEIMGCELNRAFIRELFDQHMSGKRDHAQRLYALLVMAIWCRWYKRVQREGK